MSILFEITSYCEVVSAITHHLPIKIIKFIYMLYK